MDHTLALQARSRNILSAEAGSKIIADVAGLRRLETNYGNADHSAVNTQVRSSARCSR